jgi:hypothetical protein
MNTKPGTGYTLNMTGNDGGAPPSRPILDAYGSGMMHGAAFTEIIIEINDATQRIRQLIDTQNILLALATSGVDELGMTFPATVQTAIPTTLTPLISNTAIATISKRNNLIILANTEWTQLLAEVAAAIAATDNPILRAKKTQRT